MRKELDKQAEKEGLLEFKMGGKRALNKYENVAVNVSRQTLQAAENAYVAGRALKKGDKLPRANDRVKIGKGKGKGKKSQQKKQPQAHAKQLAPFSSQENRVSSNMLGGAGNLEFKRHEQGKELKRQQLQIKQQQLQHQLQSLSNSNHEGTGRAKTVATGATTGTGGTGVAVEGSGFTDAANLHRRHRPTVGVSGRPRTGTSSDSNANNESNNSNKSNHNGSDCGAGTGAGGLCLEEHAQQAKVKHDAVWSRRQKVWQKKQKKQQKEEREKRLREEQENIQRQEEQRRQNEMRRKAKAEEDAILNGIKMHSKAVVRVQKEKERVEQLEKYCSQIVHKPEPHKTESQDEGKKTVLQNDENEIALIPVKSIADQSYHQLGKKASHILLPGYGVRSVL